MSSEIIVGFVYNAALLLVLSTIYSFIYISYEKNAFWKQALMGVVIGLIGITLMLTPVKLIPGVFFDLRSVLVCVAAMYFGFIPTVIAVAIICAARIVIGGDGALTGVLVTICTSAVGYLWHKFRLKHAIDKTRYKYIEFYIVGIFAHIAMLLCMFALPKTQQLTVFKQMWFTILFIYPLVSLALSLVLYNGLMNNQTRLALIDNENKYRALYLENQNKQTLLKTLIDSVPDLIFYKDINSVYVGCNAAFEKFLGRAENEIVARSDLDLFIKEKAESFIAVDQEIIEQGKPYKDDFISTYPDGTEVRLETLKTSYCNKQGEVLGVIGISRDITERKKKEEEIIYISYHDYLTGAYNRRFFEEEFKQLNTETNFPIAVVMGDVNGLKLINDSFGHLEGDEMLKDVVNKIGEVLKSSDVLARIGGDEFGILLPKTSELEAHNVIKRINENIEKKDDNKAFEDRILSVSFGFAIQTEVGEDLGLLMKEAEGFMYNKKFYDSRSLKGKAIDVIMNTLFEKSPREKRHSERVGNISAKIAETIGFDVESTNKIRTAGYLHDIGKIGIPENILNKKGKLDEQEMLVMKTHPERSWRVLQNSQEFSEISNIVLYHHEKWDGSGYPKGLKGEQIPINARIIKIADAYDAMTKDRSYRKKMTPAEAISELQNCSGTDFDPQIVEVFIGQVLANEKELFYEAINLSDHDGNS